MHSSYSGVTLTAANHLFLLEPFHHIPETQQIIARISRQGQRKPCFIYHMCGSGTVEEAVLVKRERPASVIQILSAPISTAVPLPADVVAHSHSMPVAVNSETFEPQVGNHSRVAEDLAIDVSKRPRSPSDDTSSHAIHRPASAAWTLPSQDPLPPSSTATPNTFSQQLLDTGPVDSPAPAGSTATALSPAEAAGNAAYDALSRMFYCAGVVPTRDYQDLARKLIVECFPSESVIRRGLRDDPALLCSIGMKVGQHSCLTRYFSKPPAAAGAAPPAHPEAAALSNLTSLFAAAGVIHDKDLDDEYETMARRLMEQGVADGISLRDSLACSPPALDLKSIVVKRGQAYTIMDFIDKM
jgi:hypothetical protein